MRRGRGQGAGDVEQDVQLAGGKGAEQLGLKPGHDRGQQDAFFLGALKHLGGGHLRLLDQNLEQGDEKGIVYRPLARLEKLQTDIQALAHFQGPHRGPALVVYAAVVQVGRLQAERREQVVILQQQGRLNGQVRGPDAGFAHFVQHSDIRQGEQGRPEAVGAAGHAFVARHQVGHGPKAGQPHQFVVAQMRGQPGLAGKVGPLRLVLRVGEHAVQEVELPVLGLGFVAGVADFRGQIVEVELRQRLPGGERVAAVHGVQHAGRVRVEPQLAHGHGHVADGPAQIVMHEHGPVAEHAHLPVHLKRRGGEVGQVMAAQGEQAVARGFAPAGHFRVVGQIRVGGNQRDLAAGGVAIEQSAAANLLKASMAVESKLSLKSARAAGLSWWEKSAPTGRQRRAASRHRGSNGLRADSSALWRRRRSLTRECP